MPAPGLDEVIEVARRFYPDSLAEQNIAPRSGLVPVDAYTAPE